MLLNLISLRYPGRYFRKGIFQLLAINAIHTAFVVLCRGGEGS